MKLYLLDHTNSEFPGHTIGLEFELRQRGITMVDTTAEADLVLAVLDYEWPHGEGLLDSYSKTNRPMFVYIPRGTIAPLVVSNAINEHCRVCGKKAVQRVYTYDKTSDIISWVTGWSVRFATNPSQVV